MYSCSVFLKRATLDECFLRQGEEILKNDNILFEVEEGLKVQFVVSVEDLVSVPRYLEYFLNSLFPVSFNLRNSSLILCIYDTAKIVLFY